MDILFNDLSRHIAAHRTAVDAAITRVLDRGHFILGPEVEAFERAFASYLTVDHVIGVANGTDAIQLTLMALNIGPGDEVICPAMTAAPTALAILAAGAQPVFADIDPLTGTLDPARLEECLSPRTKAVIPVHLYGMPADLPAILAFASANDLIVIEDAAQAHGAMINERKVGSFGQAGCFSFYPTKNLGAYGDGGAVSTSDPDLAARLRRRRDLGQAARFDHIEDGVNSRLDEIQAAILLALLPSLNEENALRQERAAWYTQLLADVNDLQLPASPDGYHHSFHLYVVLHPERDRLRRSLAEQGIGSDVHYPMPLHRQAVFADYRIASGGLEVSESFAQEILSLPMYPHLTRKEVERVAAAIQAAFS